MGGRGCRLFGATIPYFLPTIPCLFIFLRTLLHFFALVKITTLFFSWDCALFDQKTGGRDILLTSRAYTEFAWRLLANLSSKSASVDSALSAAGTSPTGSGCQFRFFCFTFNFKR